MYGVEIVYKGRTDINSPIEPNEVVCLATLLLYYLLDRDKRTAKCRREYGEEMRVHVGVGGE